MKIEAGRRIIREINVLVSYFNDPIETRRLIDEEGATRSLNNRQQWVEASLNSLRATTGYFLVFLLAELSLWFALVLNKAPTRYGCLLFAIPLSLIFGHWLLDFIYWRTRTNRKRRSKFFRKDCRESFMKCSSSKIFFWRLGCYLNLWSLRTIWLWMLVVSIATVLMKFFALSDWDSIVASKELLTSLLMALVAYIATNVVREMLQMRVRYQDSVQTIQDTEKSLKGLKEDFDKQNEQIDLVSKSLNKQASVIAAITDIAGIKRLLNEMLKNTEDSELLSLIQGAFRNIGQEAEAISERIDAIPGERKEKEMFQKMYLNVLNPYVEAELRAFRLSTAHQSKNIGIVTRFSVAGQMVRGLLEAEIRSKTMLTFHALLVIPPARFLNYVHPAEGKSNSESTTKSSDESWKRLKGGDHDWDAYLRANLKAVEKTVNVKRQFLAITDGDSEEFKKLPPEARALHSTSVKNQLKLFVECDTKYVPVWVNPDTNEIIRDHNGIEQWKYRIEEKIIGQNLPELPSAHNTKWVEMAEVIGTKFHIPNNCFVREITAAQFIDPSDAIGKLLKDTATGKPWDYFAAHDEAKNKWVFCLRIRYDKDFDVAILDILYPNDTREWKETTARLETLFNNLKNVPEIRKYAES